MKKDNKSAASAGAHYTRGDCANSLNARIKTSRALANKTLSLRRVRMLGMSWIKCAITGPEVSIGSASNWFSRFVFNPLAVSLPSLSLRFCASISAECVFLWYHFSLQSGGIIDCKNRTLWKTYRVTLNNFLWMWNKIIRIYSWRIFFCSTLLHRSNPKFIDFIFQKNKKRKHFAFAANEKGLPIFGFQWYFKEKKILNKVNQYWM